MNTSTNSSAPAELTGIDFFVYYLEIYLPYSLLNALAALFGVFGNLCIIFVILFNRELHNTTNMFIFNLALSDLSISGLVDTFTVVGSLTGKRFFDQNILLCKFVASVCLISCITSLLSIGLLALNRYVHICHHSNYRRIFTRPSALCFCALTWLGGLLIYAPNLTPWGGLVFDLKTRSCLWNRLATQSYSIFFPLSSIIAPCLCIFFCYMRIFLFVRDRKKKALYLNKDQAKSFRLAKALFGSFVLFTIAWVPYGLVVMIDFGDRMPHALHAYTMLMAHMNSTMNPLLYYMASSGFKNGYKSLFGKMSACCCCYIFSLKEKANSIKPLRSVSVSILQAQKY